MTKSLFVDPVGTQLKPFMAYLDVICEKDGAVLIKHWTGKFEELSFDSSKKHWKYSGEFDEIPEKWLEFCKI